MKTLASVLLIPGLANSGSEHWQSLWQARHPEYRRVEQADWDTPRCADWVRTLDACIRSIEKGSVVLAAHSLGCVTIAHYAAIHGDGEGRLAAAFLVAPTDVDALTFPPGSTGFNPMPLRKLPFHSVVVTSTDDPYVTLERAEFFAHSWGSRLIKIAKAGRINAASGYGSWSDGEQWLAELREIRA
jgi:predicted alpha/beta hydrolase family esterase